MDQDPVIVDSISFLIEEICELKLMVYIFFYFLFSLQSKNRNFTFKNHYFCNLFIVSFFVLNLNEVFTIVIATALDLTNTPFLCVKFLLLGFWSFFFFFFLDFWVSV